MTDPNTDAMTPLDLPDLAGAPLGGSCEVPPSGRLCTGMDALAKSGCCRWPCSEAAAPSGPGADGRAKLGAAELFSLFPRAPWAVPAASLLVADGAAADSPGKAVLGALPEGADTRARDGGPTAEGGAAALEAAAAFTKL